MVLLILALSYLSISIDGKPICNLRFADDIDLMAASWGGNTKTSLHGLKEAAAPVVWRQNREEQRDGE